MIRIEPVPGVCLLPVSLDFCRVYLVISVEKQLPGARVLYLQTTPGGTNSLQWVVYGNGKFPFGKPRPRILGVDW